MPESRVNPVAEQQKSITDEPLLPGPLQRPIRLGVLISVGGTTLLNFLREIDADRLQAEIPLVIASRQDCAGVTRAEAAGLTCKVIGRKSNSKERTTAELSEAVFQELREANVDLVLLAGYLSLLHIPADFTNRVMNIHPSLIPAFSGSGFYGERIHTAAIARGVKFSGCTVHFADNQYDHGPIILQKVVPVEPNDTPASLAKRVFAAECSAFPEAVRLFAAGRLVQRDGLIHVRPAAE